MTKPRRKYRHVLLTSMRDGDAPAGIRCYVETLKRWQRGPRRQHEITDPVAVEMYLTAPRAVLWDYLLDNPAAVEKISKADLFAAAEEVRAEGGCFARG